MIYLYGDPAEVANFVRASNYGPSSWSRVIDPSELEGAVLGSILIPVKCELPVEFRRAAHAFGVTIISSTSNIVVSQGRREGKANRLRESIKTAQEQLKNYQEEMKAQEQGSPPPPPPPPNKKLLVGLSHEVDYFVKGMQWTGKDYSHVSKAEQLVGWQLGTQVVFLGSWRRSYGGQEIWDIAHEPPRGFKCCEIASIDDYLKTFGPKTKTTSGGSQEAKDMYAFEFKKAFEEAKQEEAKQEAKQEEVHDIAWAEKRCFESLNAALEEAGCARLTLETLSQFSGADLIKMIAQGGIRFTQLSWEQLPPF